MSWFCSSLLGFANTAGHLQGMFIDNRTNNTFPNDETSCYVYKLYYLSAVLFDVALESAIFALYLFGDLFSDDVR